MANAKLYEVTITREDDSDGFSGIDLSVPGELIPLIADMALHKGHIITITKCENVATD